ncbi:MAG: glycine dehydrogenase subunit 2 [Clostridiales bacterium]|uniref:aminomethyl-transferring glycine dehydrogenase subunit GcvPB n=1 Tax=Provencibacterium massiliense TaxID=1841868 RepID=UPI0009A74597|nr:aminomethyl-transferring glycine dehydrogenase subunit GcvPB [Provencibacterium massiliense]PWM36283.1 MAG: glycine dehydrogenase subunit 2 [Clostridiales bacterium]RGB67254.1 glycine dehydrogenase subunit 2 [Harryflintia acetispora]
MSKLIFERSVEGRGCSLLPESPFERTGLPAEYCRERAPRLPQITENDLCRHYTSLAQRSFGVNCGFYPLGSCTMKYNPKVNEVAASLEGFTEVHPYQPAYAVQGCLEVLDTAERYLCEITGMDAVTFQPAAGAHGEYTGLLLIKAYHHHRGEDHRNKIIVPDSAHGTNPASATMAGYAVVSIPSASDGCVDLDALRAAAGPDTAGIMLTNPNTVGLFDRNILEITKVVHDAGGLCYYDGANLNAVMGIARPGDMGFDVVHLNLHKTFSTPHGGGGPGSGAVGCKELLTPFLPAGQVEKTGEGYRFAAPGECSIGRVKSFYGNFLVVVRALCYLLMLGREGIPAAAQGAVLNANYMMKKLSSTYDIPYPGPCMHEFVMSLQSLKDDCSVSAMDIAKGLLDRGIHPPTMYFPLIVHEALMVEPTETESRETLNEAIDAFLALYEEAKENPQKLHEAPITTPVGRPDEVKAARSPVLRHRFGEE